MEALHFKMRTFARGTLSALGACELGSLDHGLSDNVDDTMET